MYFLHFSLDSSSFSPLSFSTFTEKRSSTLDTQVIRNAFYTLLATSLVLAIVLVGILGKRVRKNLHVKAPLIRGQSLTSNM